jgi:hypothetical protein
MMLTGSLIPDEDQDNDTSSSAKDTETLLLS